MKCSSFCCRPTETRSKTFLVSKTALWEHLVSFCHHRELKVDSAVTLLVTATSSFPPSNLQGLGCGCYGNNSLPGKAVQHIHRFIRSPITQLPPDGPLGKLVSRKGLPHVLPFAILLNFWLHYIMLRRQGVSFLVGACFVSLMGGILNEKCWGVMRWMLKENDK